MENEFFTAGELKQILDKYNSDTIVVGESGFLKLKLVTLTESQKKFCQCDEYLTIIEKE